MKKWKKVLAVMSVAVVCAAGVPMTGLQTVLPEGTLTASAAANYGDLTYEYSEDGTIMITDCNTSATEVEIPASIDGAAVTSIGDSAFEDCDKPYQYHDSGQCHQYWRFCILLLYQSDQHHHPKQCDQYWGLGVL